MLCEVPGDVQRLENRMLLAERDITKAEASFKATEERFVDHMRHLSNELARLHDYIETLVRRDAEHMKQHH